MEEAPNEASWSQSRQAEEGEGLIEGETHGGGWKERKRGIEGGRHAGCMATEAALLYQEEAVGVFLPNSAEKPKTMPSSTSANRDAITSLIDVFLFRFSPPHSRHVGRQSIIITVQRGCFCSSTPHTDLIQFVESTQKTVQHTAGDPTRPPLQLRLHTTVLCEHDEIWTVIFCGMIRMIMR